MYFGSCGFRGEFVFNYVYVDLKYNDIDLTFTTGSVCFCSGLLC